MLGLPRSARLVVWGNCWLAGQVTLDEVVTRVQSDDEPHTVADLPPRGASGSLGTGLGLLRADGVKALQVALPRAGDPQGLAGPSQLTIEAVAAGEAVLCVGLSVALVPAIRSFGPPGDHGHLVSWGWRDAVQPLPGPTSREADRVLSEQLIAASSLLTDLDAAAWRPQMAQVLDDLRSGAVAEPLPRPFPAAAQALAARAIRVLTVVGVGLDDDGSSLFTQEAQARRDALVPLERAARHALAAACNALAE
ncbi:MAG TPA: hypothetical protein VHI11_12045 [Jiangellaceae bacterium]|jgi:hypothetical protein|nr:hypothetical protein [Jiangellaceae bacterium]